MNAHDRSGLPELGVGLTYSSGMDEILEHLGDSVGVLEIEPQMLWFETGSKKTPYRPNEEILKRLRQLSVPKLIHSVSIPVGGTVPPDETQFDLLREMILELDSPWLSEHLAFNRASSGEDLFNTGFLLPPRQTPEGIETAVRSIGSLAAAMPVPLAIETGVSYLEPRSDELEDGAFVAEIARRAECGILLDLHNLWTNERNGRQPLDDFLHQLPLDRVWEVHIAGGFESDGYWLDAHSGTVPSDLMGIARHLVPRLPNLRALIFEIFPAFLQKLSDDELRTQLDDLWSIWEARGRDGMAPAAPRPLEHRNDSDRTPSPIEWEFILGSLAVRQPIAKSGGDGGRVPRELANQLQKDPGLPLIQRLVEQFRASMVTDVLRLTCRLLTLHLGREGLLELFADYWKDHPPELFGSAEARGFADYLRTAGPEIEFLGSVLDFELATIATLIDRRSRIVEFSHDPLMILRALIDGKKPEKPPPGQFEIELTGDSVERDQRRSSLPAIFAHH